MRSVSANWRLLGWETKAYRCARLWWLCILGKLALSACLKYYRYPFIHVHLHQHWHELHMFHIVSFPTWIRGSPSAHHKPTSSQMNPAPGPACRQPPRHVPLWRVDKRSKSDQAMSSEYMIPYPHKMWDCMSSSTLQNFCHVHHKIYQAGFLEKYPHINKPWVSDQPSQCQDFPLHNRH